MDPAQALLLLKADLEAIQGECAEQGWVIETWPITSVTFYVKMGSDIDKESYTFRFVWDGYPYRAASIHCVDAQSKDPRVPSAWPKCEGFRPCTDLCLNVSREGLEALHPDWAKDKRYAWDSSGNPALRVFWTLQDRLNDRTKYNGRNK